MKLQTFILLILINLNLVEAQDLEYLMMGGGTLPSRNQVSIEYNFKFLMKTMGSLGYGSPKDTFYSDGNELSPDVQIALGTESKRELDHFLSQILNGDKGIKYSYRNHEIGEISGPCQKEFIQEGIDHLLASSSEKKMISFFGHGLSSRIKGKRDTNFVTFNESGMRVSEFSKALSEQKEDTPIILFMTQCYSGGFADFIFIDGNPDFGLSSKPRCGFFSTVHHRPSTGCTTAVDNPEYVDYGGLFWACMGGEDHKGQKFTKPDYNNDGKTSMVEAHAYTIINAKTIDVPYLTSDRLLEFFSKEKDPKKFKEMIDRCKFSDYVDKGGDLQKLVLNSLADQLGLGVDQTMKVISGNAEKLASEIGKHKKKLHDLGKKRYGHIKKIRQEVLSRWPILNNPWDSRGHEAITQDREKMISTIKNHDAQKEIKKLDQEIEELQAKYKETRYEEAKHLRLIQAFRSLFLEVEMRKHGSKEVIAHFEKIKDLELQAMVH